MDSLRNALCNEPNQIPLFLEQLRLKKKEVVLYGAGYCCHEALGLLHRYQIPIKEVCDDFRVGETIEGYRISSIQDITMCENSVIIITSGFNVEMKERLVELGLIRFFVEIDFGRYDIAKENKDYFVSHMDDIEYVYSLFSDNQSKYIFLGLINYRISRDLKYLKGLMETTPQYFPEELLSRRGGQSTFLDLGAYDGDSIKAFLKFVHGEYKEIIAVEASKKNYNLLLENMAGYNNIFCYNVGVFDKPGMIKFKMDDAKNAFISDEGSQIIPMDTVDNILNHRPVDYIKMDIEGAEYEALQGARTTLQECSPVLMVSVYHKVEDLYRLQLLIEDICPGKYAYYLRHYSPTVIETVLYAIPKERKDASE